MEIKGSELDKLSEKQETNDIKINGLKDYVKELEEENIKLKGHILRDQTIKYKVCDYTPCKQL